MRLKDLKIIVVLITLHLSTLLMAADINTLVRNGNLEDLKREPLSALAYDYKDSLGRNALAIAISANQIEIAKYLIVGGIGINVRDFVGKTPLMSALVNKNSELVKMLLIAKASTAIKDKAGRDILFYAELSQDAELIKLAHVEISKGRKPSIEDLGKLKTSLLNLDHKLLVDYFDNFKTLDVQIESKSVIEFLIENNLLEKWGLSTFLEMGVNFNDSAAIFKAIDKKNSLLVEFFLNQRVSLGTRGIDGRCVLAHALTNNMPQGTVEKIFDQMVNFEYLDLNRNNLLFYSIKAKNSIITSKLLSKGLSLNQLNADNESPLSVAVAIKGNDEIIGQLLKTDKLDFNIKDKNGNNAGINLAKNYPNIYINERSNIISKGGDLNISNAEGKNADQVLAESNPELVKPQDLDRLNTDQIPKLNPFDSKKVNYEEVKNPERKARDESDAEIDFSGERIFDKFLAETFQNYIDTQKLNYKSYLISKYKILDSENDNDQVIKDKLLKISENKSKLLENNKNISQKTSDFNLMIKKTGEMDARAEVLLGRLNSAGNKLKYSINNYSERVSKISQDLSGFASRKEELDQLISKFKASKGNIYDQINLEKRKLQMAKDSFNMAARESNARYNGEVSGERAYLSQVESENSALKKKRFDKNKEVNDFSFKIEENNKNIEMNRASIANPAHNHVEDINKCPYLKNIDQLNKSNDFLSKKILELQNDLKGLDTIISSSDKTKAFAANEYNKILQTKAHERDSRKIYLDKALEEELAKSERQLAVLEMDNREYYAELMEEINKQKSELEIAYGNLETLDESWRVVTNVSTFINSGIQSLDNAFVCGGILIGLDFCNLISKNKLEQGNFKDLLGPLDDIGNTYLTYKKAQLEAAQTENSDALLAGLKNDLEILNSEKDRLNEEALELNNQLEDEKKNQNSDLGNEQDLDKLIALDSDLVINNIIQDVFSVADLDFNQNLTQKLTTVFEISKGDDFLSFVSRNPPLPVSYVPVFGKLDYFTIKEVRELENDEKRIALVKWYRLILANASLQGKVFENNVENFFANSVVSNVAIKIVQDANKALSLKIITKAGSFIVDDRGAVVELPTDDFFKFEVVSSGDKKRRIEDLLKEFESAIGGRLSKEQLKADYGINLILNMIKTADNLDNLEMAGEMLDVAEVFIRTGIVLSGAEAAVPLSNVFSCGLQIYKYTLGGVRLDFPRVIDMGTKCMSMNRNFEEYIEHSMPYLEKIRELVKKYTGPAYLKLSQNGRKAVVEFSMSLAGFINYNTILSSAGDGIRAYRKFQEFKILLNANMQILSKNEGVLKIQLTDKDSINLTTKSNVVFIDKMVLYSYLLPNKVTFYTYENIFDKQSLSNFLIKNNMPPIQELVNVSLVEVKKGDRFVHSTFMFTDILTKVNK